MTLPTDAKKAEKTEIRYVQTCKRRDCTNPAYVEGICAHHYQPCKAVDLQGKPACKKPMVAHGYCMMHYQRTVRAKAEDVKPDVSSPPKHPPKAPRQISFLVSEPTRARLDVIAAKRKVPTYALVKAAVREGLEQGGKGLDEVDPSIPLTKRTLTVRFTDEEAVAVDRLALGLKLKPGTLMRQLIERAFRET